MIGYSLSLQYFKRCAVFSICDRFIALDAILRSHFAGLHGRVVNFRPIVAVRQSKAHKR